MGKANVIHWVSIQIYRFDLYIQAILIFSMITQFLHGFLGSFSEFDMMISELEVYAQRCRTGIYTARIEPIDYHTGCGHQIYC